MTDNTVTDPTNVDEGPETTTETEKKVPALEALNDFAQRLVVRAKVNLEKLVANVTAQEKADNVGKLLSEARENSELAEVKQRMAKIEKANKLIVDLTNEVDAILKPSLDLPTEEDKARLTEEYKALSVQVSAADAMFVDEVKIDFSDLTDFSIYDYIGQPPKTRRSGGAKSGQGSGTSRPRVKAVEWAKHQDGPWTKAADDKGNSTFSQLVLALKKETKEDLTANDLHEAWTAQNGGVSWDKMPEVTTFVYSVKSVNYFIRVTR